MLQRKILILLGLISFLSYVSCSRRRRITRYNNNNYNDNRCEGEGCIQLGPTGTAILITVVVIFTVLVLGVLIYCKCCRNTSNNMENVAFSGRGGPTVTGPAVTSVTTAPQKTDTFKPVFSSDELKLVETPCDITDDEQMTMYRQDQIWLNEIAKEGRGVWKMRKDLEYRNDLQGKRNLKRFSCMYNPKLGGGNSCNSCRDGLHGKGQWWGEWYRCRECVDVDFCAVCFSKGPIISAYGHVPGHECTKLKVGEMCFICKGLIYDTKMSCDDCHHVYFCLGCYNTGRHEEGHTGHLIKRIEATSYIMVKAAVAGKESTPLLPPGEKHAEATAPPISSTYPSGGAENIPMMSVPEVPPPAYDDCT